MKNPTHEKTAILLSNKKLIGPEQEVDFNETEAQEYFSNFRILFAQFEAEFKASSDINARKKMIEELCTINGLYSIKLKAHKEIPADLADIAYDFDNPEYPGYSHIKEKIMSGGYKLATI